jgi:hypothetical protein
MCNSLPGFSFSQALYYLTGETKKIYQRKLKKNYILIICFAAEKSGNRFAFSLLHGPCRVKKNLIDAILTDIVVLQSLPRGIAAVS